MKYTIKLCLISLGLLGYVSVTEAGNKFQIIIQNNTQKTLYLGPRKTYGPLSRKRGSCYITKKRSHEIVSGGRCHMHFSIDYATIVTKIFKLKFDIIAKNGQTTKRIATVRMWGSNKCGAKEWEVPNRCTFVTEILHPFGAHYKAHFGGVTMSVLPFTVGIQRDCKKDKYHIIVSGG